MSRKKKVLFFIEHQGPGGAEQVVVSLAEALEKSGDVETLTVSLRTGWIDETLRSRGLRHEHLESTRSLDLGLPFRLAALCRREKVDCIHSHLLDSNFYAALASKIARIPHVATDHGDVHHSSPKKHLSLKIGALRLPGTEITAVSRYTAEFLIQKGAPRCRVHVVHNPLFEQAPPTPDARDRLRSEWNATENCVVWLHIGRISPVKDQAGMIRGFAQALLLSSTPQLLCIAGDGDGKADLEQLAVALGIADRCLFLGFRNDTQDLLAAADGFILHSLSEAMPMALLEAAAAGKILVATDVGGIRDVVPGDAHGYLIPAGDPPGLARTLADICDELEAAQARALQARTYVHEHFGLEQILQQYRKLYRFPLP